MSAHGKLLRQVDLELSNVLSFLRGSRGADLRVLAIERLRAEIREQIENPQITESQIDEFVRTYEMSCDSGGIYVPSEQERLIIKDAIMGLLTDTGEISKWPHASHFYNLVAHALMDVGTNNEGARFRLKEILKELEQLSALEQQRDPTSHHGVREAEDELNCAEEVLDSFAAQLDLEQTDFDCIGEYITAVCRALEARANQTQHVVRLALEDFANRERGVPQAHIAAQLVGELEGVLQLVECKIDRFSSRTCEHGTNSCTTEHALSAEHLLLKSAWPLHSQSTAAQEALETDSPASCLPVTCRSCNGEGGHEKALSSTNYTWVKCNECNGSGRTK